MNDTIPSVSHSGKLQRETLTKLNIIYRIFKQDAMPEHEATHMALKDIVNNTRLQPPNLGVSGMVAHATFHGGVQYVTEEDRILLPVCYFPRQSRITQIYLKQEGNPSPNPGNTRCLPQGINNCPQQQWLVYLLQIIITLFLRSGPYAGRGRLILLALITIGASHISQCSSK